MAFIIKLAAKELAINAFALLAFAVVVLLAGASMLYGLSFLDTWYGFVGAIVVTAILVEVLDMNY